MKFWILKSTTCKRRCVHFVHDTLEHLIPLLIEILTSQSEDADAEEDMWTISMSSPTCFRLLKKTVEDAVSPRVMTFVQDFIRNAN